MIEVKGKYNDAIIYSDTDMMILQQVGHGFANLCTIYLNLRRQGHTDKEPKMINLYNLIKHISNLDFDIKHGVDLNASDLKICKMASKLDPKTNTLSKVNEILEVFNK